MLERLLRLQNTFFHSEASLLCSIEIWKHFKLFSVSNTQKLSSAQNTSKFECVNLTIVTILFGCFFSSPKSNPVLSASIFYYFVFWSLFLWRCNLFFAFLGLVGGLPVVFACCFCVTASSFLGTIFMLHIEMLVNVVLIEPEHLFIHLQRGNQNWIWYI